MHIIIYIVYICALLVACMMCMQVHMLHYIHIYIVNLQCMPAHLGMNPVFEVSERHAKTVNCFCRIWFDI